MIDFVKIVTDFVKIVIDFVSGQSRVPKHSCQQVLFFFK